MHLLTLLSGVLAISTQVSARTVPHVFARHTEGDCTPQPLGAGPVPSLDTPQAFLADTDFDNAANNAVTPVNYTQVFKDQHAASVSSNYLGFDTLTTYDPNFCAQSCASNYPGCDAFNIYFERDPTLDPGVNCTNPPSTTMIKCAYFGSPLSASSTTNSGQVCANFTIVIAGSNGYNLAPPSQCTAGSQVINGRTCTISCNTDRPGGDYGRSQVPSLAACEQACAADPECVTAQYREDIHFCYFKNVTDTAVPASGIDTVDCSSVPGSSTTTTSVSATTTPATTTSGAVTTTTKASTSTTKASTTTTAKTTPQSTPTDSPCFRLYGTGPAFINNDQLSLDDRSRLSYSASGVDTIFTLDKYGALRSATNQGALMYRSTECKKHATFGFVSTHSEKGWWIVCNKAKLAGNGKGGISCSLYGQSNAQDFYATSSDGEVVMGTSNPVGPDGKPMNNKPDWQTFGVVYQPAICPNGGAWTTW